MKSKIVKLIDKTVIPKPKPAVCISGGIDSTIMLHHLSNKTKETIHTYHLSFKDENHDTPDEARQVAEYYHTIHHEVAIEGVPQLLKLYEEVIPHLERPNFDLWVYPLAKEIKKDGHLTIYTGDGLDEHFGGYWYRKTTDYLEDWAGTIIYQIPPRKTIYNLLNLQYECPLLHLDFKQTLPYYDHTKQKKLLRKAYEGILPKFVVERRKERGGIDYWKLWRDGLRHQFPTVNSPRTHDGVRKMFHVWVAKKWLDNIQYP